MGGHPYGGEAAQMTVDSIAQFMSKLKTFPNIYKLGEVMDETNKRLRDAYKEAGVTIGGILIKAGQIAMFWLGDVRIYVLKPSGELVTSNDHSLINRLKKERVVISPDTILKYSNVVTSYLGIGREIQVGYHSFMVEKEMRVLICSDGIHQNVSFELIQSLLKESISTKKFENRLSNQKIRDNYTYLLIRT